MVLERPDPVVAHHADDPRPWRAIVSNSMPAKPKAPSPSSRQTWRSGWATLAPIAWPGPGAEAAEGPGVHPAARLVGVDEAAGVGDEVAAVADHDRVAVEHLAELPVDAHRVQRRARVVELLPLGRALLVLDVAQLLDPGARSAARSRRPPRGSPRASAATSPTRSSSGRRLAVSALGATSSRTIFVSSPKLPPKPSRKSIGTPTTSATSAPFSAGSAGAAEAELVVGGQASAAQAVEEDRDAERLGQRPQLVLAMAPVEAGAGHDRRPLRRGEQRRRLLDARRRRRRAGAGAGRHLDLGLAEDDVERVVDEGRAVGGGERQVERRSGPRRDPARSPSPSRPT